MLISLVKLGARVGLVVNRVLAHVCLMWTPWTAKCLVPQTLKVELGWTDLAFIQMLLWIPWPVGKSYRIVGRLSPSL